MNNRYRAKIYKFRRYPHFDNRLHWTKAYRMVESPEYICKHSFFPFIHYTQSLMKYPQKFLKGSLSYRDPPKQREIMYSCHIDRYIYEYYAHLINEYYNLRAKQDGINRCSVAYRNKSHKNNIHFAKEAFDAIRRIGNAYVLIGDFKSYFDSIDHQYLKARLKDLLGVNLLPPDIFSVFRSITKYSFIDLDAIKATKALSKTEWEQLDRLFSPNEFREFKREHLQTNHESFGIPQGSAISAVLSNVYLLDFDKHMNDYITCNKGFYRRYCDDFIVVLPNQGVLGFQVHKDCIFKLVNSIPRLDLQPNKVRVFSYSSERVLNCSDIAFTGADTSKNIIDYLGFAFNGERISIRQRTIAKYYRKMYKKADGIAKRNGISPSGKPIPLRSIYTYYSKYGKDIERGCNKKTRSNKGNFLTYVDRAIRIFGMNEDVGRDTKHSWYKLQKRLRGKQQ